MAMRLREFLRYLSKYQQPNSNFYLIHFMSKLSGMRKYCSVFRVQKTALIAAAAGCLALSFASPIQVAVADEADAEADLGYCPHPDIVADSAHSMLGEEEAAAASQSEDVLPAETVPVLERPDADSLR